MTDNSPAPFETSVPGDDFDTIESRFNHGEGPDPEEPESNESDNIVGILVPIMLLILILIFVTCLYLFLKYRGKRQTAINNSDNTKLQQYISTVGADNYVMASDIAAGSNFTLQFAQSYESVPRGTSQDPIPIYSVIHDPPDHRGTGTEDRNYEVIKPVRQDVRRMKKSSDTSSISSIGLPQESNSKPRVWPLHEAARRKQKAPPRRDELAAGEMSQSLGDLTNLSHLDQRKFSFDPTYQFAFDIADEQRSKRVTEQSSSFVTDPSTSSQHDNHMNLNSNSQHYNNFGFVADGNFVSSDF